MITLLKLNIKAHAFLSKSIREQERHHLSNGRKLRGIFSKKHDQGEEKPVAPQNKIPEDADRFADEAYLRYWNLHETRVHGLRKETRAMNLAYAYLRGKSYLNIEQSCKEIPNIEAIASFVDI